MGVDVGDLVGFDPGVAHGLRPRRRHLQPVGLDGDRMEGVVSEPAPEHVGVRLDVALARDDERG